MRTILHSILCLLAICSVGAGQTPTPTPTVTPIPPPTIKSLGYNATNGQVVANTGTNVLTFTNDVKFSVINSDYVGSTWFFVNDGVNAIQFETEQVAATTRANLGFSTNLNAFWTATNASNARSAIGLGANDVVVFNDTTVFSLIVQDVTPIGIAGDGLSFNDTNSTNIASAKAGWRDSLGLPLPALTNTSNVTMMRALAGSTNTNQPYSGVFSVLDASANARDITISNGIIVGIEEP